MNGGLDTRPQGGVVFEMAAKSSSHSVAFHVRYGTNTHPRAGTVDKLVGSSFQRRRLQSIDGYGWAVPHQLIRGISILPTHLDPW